MNISLSPFTPENLILRDGFGSPVPRQSAHFHNTQAEHSKVSWKSRLNTICRLIVIFSVKVRNSFKEKYFRHLTRVFVRFPETKGMSKFTVPHFSRGETLFIRALNVCKKGAKFKLNHWYS